MVKTRSDLLACVHRLFLPLYDNELVRFAVSEMWEEKASVARSCYYKATFILVVSSFFDRKSAEALQKTLSLRTKLFLCLAVLLWLDGKLG